MTSEHIRNVAIIAHVDHGKTTLVDSLLKQSGMFKDGELDKLAGGQHNLIMDSNPMERERGITILSKNCALSYESPKDGQNYKINVIDTPGHADFGGEVERVLSMADGVMLVVDSFEGPMPQTRYVLQKAMEHGLEPIVVVNKVDRPDGRPNDVVNEVFDLLVELEAKDSALEFVTLFASARDGWAVTDLNDEHVDMRCVFDTIVEHVPAPSVKPEEPGQLLVTTLDYSEFVGRIAIGKVYAGKLNVGEKLAVHHADGKRTEQRLSELYLFEGLGRKKVESVEAGDICALIGFDPIGIGDTVADAENGTALPPLTVDEPTLHMSFRVNNGPFAGKEGEFVTSRQIRDRLHKELKTNVALRVKDGATPEEFIVSGRGLMHLGILLESMRREGFELCVGKPEVIFQEVDGQKLEPIEHMVIDCPSECQNSVMSLLGNRRAEILGMSAKDGTDGYVHLEFTIPARGLVGVRNRLLNATKGRAIMHHTFLEYQPMRGSIPSRIAGVMLSSEQGQITPYALDCLYDRGFFFVKPGEQVYEGQVVGEHCKDSDITVNVVRPKKLTNVRASGRDDNSQVRPATEMSLEAALEYIQEDELAEITPQNIRMRKRVLNEGERKRASRAAKAAT